ncbi:MAG: rRNA pseudouridine synthase [Desulfotalea sp.]
MNEMRLQKYLACSGLTSRRKAEQFILDGRVEVDGKVVTELGTKVTPDKETVKVDGKLIKLEEQKVYYLLHKPRGYVTTLSDPQGRPVITELMTGVKERVYPVGRLDFDTEGALIMTNDGDLSQKILHPSFETFKTYHANLKGIPSKSNLDKLAHGISIDNKMTAPAKISVISRNANSCTASITIHEGRKHQVKKMFAAIGHPVTYLKRIAYGKLKLGNIPKGQFISLSSKDLELIF